MGDVSEFYELAADLSEVGAKSVPALRGAMTQAGAQVKNAWRRDAAATHDSHAKYYSDSIMYDLLPGISQVAVEVGPTSSSRQGFLGPILEFGGTHSPAYMTGAKALERSQAAIERGVTNALDPLFP